MMTEEQTSLVLPQRPFVGWTTTGGQSAKTMSGLDDAQGRWGSSTTFAWGALAHVAKE